jgi:hypothetical protein
MSRNYTYCRARISAAKLWHYFKQQIYFIENLVICVTAGEDWNEALKERVRWFMVKSRARVTRLDIVIFALVCGN